MPYQYFNADGGILTAKQTKLIKAAAKYMNLSPKFILARPKESDSLLKLIEKHNGAIEPACEEWAAPWVTE